MSGFLIVMLMAFTFAACGGGEGRSGGGGKTSPTNSVVTVASANFAPTVTSTHFELEQSTDLSTTLTASDPAHGQIVSFAAPDDGELL